MDFQGVQLMDLDIHTARGVLARTIRADGMRIDVSRETNFSKPMKRTGETYVDDLEDYATTIETLVYAGPPDEPNSIHVYVYYDIDRHGDVTTFVEKFEYFVDTD